MRRLAGFTLIELLVTIAIMAILMAFAVPSFVQQIQSNQVVTTASKLREALSYARSEAIKRSAFVTICPSSNGTSCLSSTAWATGWLVFIDGASYESSSSVTVGTVLLFWDDIDSDVNVSAKKGSSGSLSFLRFNDIGLLAKSSVSDTDSRSFQIQADNCSTSTARTISVGYAGIISSVSATCS